MNDALFSDTPRPEDQVQFSDEPRPEDAPLSDALKNIGPDAARIAKDSFDTTARIAKGVNDLPSDILETGKQELQGGNIGDTPIAQDVKTIGKGIGGAISGIPESIGNLASKGEWIQHPVQNAITAGGLLTGGVEGMSKLAPEGAAVPRGILGSLGESIKERGQSQATNLSDISADTVKKMNPRVFSPEAQKRIRMAGSTPNVADIRNEIGNKLAEDKVVSGYGQDIGDRLQAINEKKDAAGKNVDTFIKKIKETNRSRGEYSDVDDELHAQANPILKPIIDTANDLRNSSRSGLRQTSRFWRETYDSLSKKAESNNGRLSLDDIRSEMQDVGKDMNGTEGTKRYSVSKDIYGHLAEIEHGMINDIAKSAGDKKLAKNLFDANKEYTFYSRVANDTKNAAAGGEEPENMGKHLARASIRGNPLEATGYLGIINALNSVEPALAPKLIKVGGMIEKYGPVLAESAKKGSRNLAITSHLISQNDPKFKEALSD